MRLLQIRLLFNGLFDYFSQFQAVNFITERSSCKERRHEPHLLIPALSTSQSLCVICILQSLLQVFLYFYLLG